MKQVKILEKSKRDQIVGEVRIMRKHTSPWLVSLCNAFYEEAKVFTVIEYMDRGSLAELISKHKGKGMADEHELARIATALLRGLRCQRGGGGRPR